MNKKPTKEEMDLLEALVSRGLRVLSQVPDGHKHIDLAIPDAKINIEIDGPRHWTNGEQIVADLKRSHFSDDLGYYTIHISNDHIHSELEKIADALVEAASIRIEQLKKE